MSEATIAAVLRARAVLGERQFIVADSERLTYNDAEARSRKLASAFLAVGIGRSSRVAMLFGNSVDFALCFLALTRIGAIAMPLSTLSTAPELRTMLAGADAEFLIATPCYRGKQLRTVIAEALGAAPGEALLLSALPCLRAVWLGVDELEAAGAPDDPRVAAAEALVTPADHMVVIHTSGSTSTPKGVVHSHGQIIRNMARQNRIRDFTQAECLFSNSPWFWIGGLAFSFLASLIAGAKLLCSSASPTEMLDLLEAEQPTMTNGVASTMLALASDPGFASRDLSSIRRGNLYPIMPEAVRPADPELRYNLLGMSELGSVCLIGDHEEDLPEEKRGSFGRPVPGVTIRLVDPDTGEDASAGESWARGPNVMQGYYGRERHECFDEDGWFHTGDMMTRDRDGDHFFKGRSGDIIRTSGAQVSPREVEAAISEVAGGQLAIVVGVPDAQRGQLVAAVMVGSDGFDAQALRDALKARLAPYKIPRKWLAMAQSELPTLSSGKIDVKRLAEIAGAA